MGSPIYPVIANTYLQHFDLSAITTSSALIKWSFREIDDVYNATRKDQINKLQEHLNSIDPNIKFTIECPGLMDSPS